MTILTFTLPFLLKRQLLCVLLMIRYSKILFLQADNILLVTMVLSSDANYCEHFNVCSHRTAVTWRCNKSSATEASAALWQVWTWSQGLHQVLAQAINIQWVQFIFQKENVDKSFSAFHKRQVNVLEDEPQEEHTFEFALKQKQHSLKLWYLHVRPQGE